MNQREIVARIVHSRKALFPEGASASPIRKGEAEGGCGVIGIASSEKIPARHLLQALTQMRNRGNGKGGGIAAVGLLPEQFGVTQEILENDYLLTIAYLDGSARPEVERTFIEPVFQVDHLRYLPRQDQDFEPPPPDVFQYFVQVRPEVAEAFRKKNGLDRRCVSRTR